MLPSIYWMDLTHNEAIEKPVFQLRYQYLD